METPTTPFETTHRDFHEQNFGAEVVGEERVCAVCGGRLGGAGGGSGGGSGGRASVDGDAGER